MTEIILASQSPRRRHLLTAMGVDFTVQASSYDEKLDDSRGIHEVAKELALGKALDVAKQHPDAIVIGSDTIVGVDDHQLEKPVDVMEARDMLLSYAGRESVVVTGLAVVWLNEAVQVVDTDLTRVYFKSDSPEVTAQRENYLQTGDWADKAGGYGIQNLRDTLIDHIKGDYDTVVGLPTALLAKILNDLGVAAKPVEMRADLTYDD